MATALRRGLAPSDASASVAGDFPALFRWAWPLSSPIRITHSPLNLMLVLASDHARGAPTRRLDGKCIQRGAIC